MLTGKEFKKHIFSLIGEHPYTWARKKGINRSVIGQLKRERIPGPKILNQLAIDLKKDVNYLISGRADSAEGHPTVQEAYTVYGEYSPEEQHQADKLLEILRHGDEEHRHLIIQTMDVLCDDRLWIREGRPKRRIRQFKYPGNNKRRRPFVYKTTSKGH